MPSSTNIYISHRGLIINLISLSLFWVWQPQITDQGAPIWLALLILLAILAEPWAMYYSMGVFNAQREQLGIQPIWLHRQMGLTSWGIVFWAGRLSIIVACIISVLQRETAEKFLQQEWLAIPLMLLLMIREGWVAYYMSSRQPFQQFSVRLDLLADGVLVLIMTAGELLFKSLMADYGIDHPSILWADPIRLVALLLFVAIFYVPIRYVHSLEDFTFAQTPWQKVERLGSFLLVVLVLIARN
jgi:hypothetical protein